MEWRSCVRRIRKNNYDKKLFYKYGRGHVVRSSRNKKKDFVVEGFKNNASIIAFPRDPVALAKQSLPYVIIGNDNANEKWRFAGNRKTS